MGDSVSQGWGHLMQFPTQPQPHSAASHPGVGTFASTTVCAGQMSISSPSGFYYFSVFPGQKAQDERLEEKHI